MLLCVESADSSRLRLLLRCGRLLRGKRVSRPSSHAQPATARRSDFYFDFSKCIKMIHALWRIAKHVLLAKILRDFPRCGCHGFARAREVSDSSGVFAEPL